VYFQIVRASGGYRWQIRGYNHEIMAVSEVYVAKASAIHAITVVRAGAAGAPVYDQT
jgi:uncharacterized protein YegP (UPF0339 family)